jgi:amino acid adenylation domain-containing protein
MNDFSKRIAALSPEQRALLELRLKQKNVKQSQSSSIPKRTVSEVLPLSSAQERLWILHQLDPDLPIYNESVLFRLVGQLDIVVLERSLNDIIRRHEILRTRIAIAEGQPIQVIAPTKTITLPIIDLQALPETEREAKAKQLANQRCSEPFNLAEAPLLRTLLLRLKENEHILLLTMHHIISDGWSWKVLFRELSTLSQADSAGNSSTLNELPIQYADFALWQRQQLQQAELKTQLTYWTQQLNGASQMLELPTDYPRPAVQTYRGRREALVLPQSLSSKLKSLSQREGVTLFVLLLAAFNTLLYRYSNSEDILVGTPVANRTRLETEPLIGCFINTLVLRTDLCGNPSFRELLARVRKVSLEAQANQELPFEQLVQELQPDRVLSHTPLFQVMFVFQEPILQALELPNLTLQPLLADSGVAKFDLTLFVEDTEQGLTGAIEYNTDLFRPDTITRMLGHFQTLLASIVANPDQRLSELQLLTDAEQHQLLVEWNDTQTDYPQDKCIHQLFEEQCLRTPDAVAVVFEDQQLTYRELNNRANQLARYLQQLGVQPDVLVGICVERSLEMVVGLLGILKAGGAYVPLDPAYPKERLAFIFQDAQVPVLLTQQRLLEKLPESQTRFVCLDTDWANIAKQSQQNLISECTTDNLAYVIYTSGSTGQPKGVLVNHSNVVRLLAATQSWYHFNQQDVFSLFHSIAFDFSVWELWGALLYGGRLVVVPYWLSRSPENFYKLLLKQQVTVLNQTPSAFRQLIQAEESLGGANNLSLRLVIFGGEALELQSLRPWFERHGDEFPQLVNMYGITETTVHVTYRPLTRADLEVACGSVIGRPIPDLQVYLLDRYGQPVPIGVRGEMYIGGAGVARGYLNRPELTTQRFIPNSFSEKPNARLYKSGDLARYLPNGDLEYLGRIDHQVKIRGFRIELGEIEAVLSQHPAVRENLVVVREDERGDKRLVAYVVHQPEQAVTITELRRFLEDKLPEYMVPSVIVQLEAVPLTPNGKVDRLALPAPDTARPELEKPFIAPRTKVEEQVAAIWSEVLGLKQVGVRDNFFELGGHSLLATQVASRVREVFGMELPLRRVFESPTVAELAESIEQVSETKTSPIQPVSRNGNLPLSFAQTRLWFLDQLEGKTATYNMGAALRLISSLQVRVLEQALTAIVQRHEVLRTSFCVIDGQPIQVINPTLTIKLPVVDLRSSSQLEQETQVLQLVCEQAKQPFDLTQNPLLRGQLLRLGDTEYVLVLTMHHIVSDAWSIDVLTRELALLYEAFRIGQPSPLPELGIQYADFAYWQRQWLQGEVLDANLSYWRQQLAGAPPVLELPTDRPRPAVQTFRGSTQFFELSSSLTDKLKRLSQQQGVTLFMTLLAAFQTLLYRYTNQEDICVGSPIANRNRREIEPLIGFFVNTLVLRTDLSDNPSFQQLLGRVRKVALDAYAHQDLPFETLVEQLQPERSLSHTPLFQVMFSLQKAATEPLALPGLKLDLLEVDIGIAQFDLSLSMEETEQGLKGRLEYSTDLFDAATIARTIGHFHTLLEGIVTAPERPISELPLLSAAERHQLLVEWNETGTEYPQDKCIHQLFEEQSLRTPDAVAVVFENQQLTYRELNSRANKIARHLQKLGVGPEVSVGICVERSLEMVVGLLGVLKAGGAYLPLDPAYPQERLAFMLKDAQVSILLTQHKSLQFATPLAIDLDKDWEVISQESEENLITDVTAENLAYVIYTSGSTGKPKGVMIQHNSLVNAYFAWEQAYQLRTAATCHLQMASFSFDVFAGDLVRALCSGGKLVLCPRELLLDPEKLYQLMLQEKVDCAEFVPAVLRNLIQYLEESEQRLDFMRLLICASDRWYMGEYKKFQGFCSPQTRLINSYGLTEATIDSSYFETATLDLSVERLVPIGRPFANTQLYILDANLQPLPIGVPGELYIGGAGLARGYLNQPELTARRFIPHPFKPGAQLYPTGDIARYLPDGTIEFLGRGDNQVKIRGFRIELGEIEAELSQHPNIGEIALLVREDEPGNKYLVAYIVPREAVLPTVSELRSFLKQKLPDYMVPSAFVMLDSLPLTPNGKVDRRALPVPDRARLGSEKTLASPRTPVEEVLAGIWAQVLEVEPVGIYDNFFELGGHSLLATQVIYRVRSALQVELPLRCLFESPTVAGLAQSIEAIAKAGQKLQAPPILPVPRDRNLPLSFAQERLWLVDRLEPNNTAYNMPAALRLVGSLNIAALEQSFNEIVRRHEVLRTTFTVVDGQPIQVIAPSLTLKIPLVDLQALPETEREAEVLRLAAQETQLPFDLAHGPMLRVTLVKLGLSEHVLLLTMHHIVFDAWSQGVFIQELAALYDAFDGGQPSPLPELSIQYADFAHWQRQWLQGEVLENLLSYWQQQLAGAPTTLDLKKIAGESSRATLQQESTTQSFVLPANLSETLKTLSRQEGVTLFMTLLAAFQTLLYRYTNQDDIVVGTDIANRNQAELEPLIGFFINLLVLRTDLSGNPSFRALLGRVREVALGAYAHQDMPFAKLVEVLRPDRRSSTTPLFQVLFVLENTPMAALKLSDLTINVLDIDTGKAKFDLALFMEETEQGLVGHWKYNTDLFHPVAIARLSHHFETLLSSIVKHPDTRIDTLEMLSETEKQKQLAEQAQREKANFKKFKTIKPKTVSLSQRQLIKTSFLQPEQSLPLVIEPDSDEIDLADWAASNREFIENNLLKHGAILFRGFNINSVPEFEKVANAIHPNLFGEYGDLPREGVSGKVYGSTPYPPDKAILFHNESSHLHRWPLKIWFFCVQPAQQGGETPILDCRKVYQLLDPKLRERFEQKQLMYVRNYIEGLDVSWQDFFHTTDKAEVENYCRQAGIDFEWLDNNGLKTRKIRPAIAKHPKTGELVFFNQLQLHHVSCLDPAVRQSLLSVFGETKLPRNVYYGDETPIEDSVLEEIGAIYRKTQVSFTWQQGDILMLDNMLTAHSRNPYVGSRKIVVAMGELMTSAEL